MNAKQKLLLLWILAMMVAAFVAAEFSSRLVFFFQHCLALAVPTLSQI